MDLRKKCEEYPYLEPRIKRLRSELEELKNNKVYCGTVLANTGPPAYHHREIPLVDIDMDTQNTIEQKTRELNSAVRQKQEVEDFINSIKDIRIQEIMTRRYLYGDSWADVAAGIGYCETEESARKAVGRYF